MLGLTSTFTGVLHSMPVEHRHIQIAYSGNNHNEAGMLLPNPQRRYPTFKKFQARFLLQIPLPVQRLF